MKSFRKLAIMIICMSYVAVTQADQDIDNNPNSVNVSVQLKHRVVVPQIIYFRVGSATFGSVDKVTIDLGQSPQFTTGTQTYAGGSIPLGNSAPIDATLNGTLDVDIRSNVGTIVIAYQVDNASGLSDGAGNFINYNQIETMSSDAANLPAPQLDNTGGLVGSGFTVTVAGNLFGGRVVNRQAQWTYRYKNETTPVAGTYEGRVTYIAASL